MIDLTTFLSDYPECLASTQKLKSYLTDLYPALEDRAKVNVLVYAHEANIVDEIRGNELDSAFAGKMCSAIVSRFSVERKAARWAVRQWCEAYGVAQLGKTFTAEDEKETQEPTLSLTRDQQRAVDSDSKRIAVVAGPGSGKTRVLIERICSLIQERGVSEDQILALSYSSKAANEMRRRLRANLGVQAGKIAVKTFHSLGLQIVRDNVELLGYTSDLEILGNSGKYKLLRELLKGYKASEAEMQNFALKISNIKNGETVLDPQVKSIFEEYNRRLKSANIIDFDDMIALPLRLFREHPEVGDYYRSAYSHVLVDEVQDLNQYQIDFTNCLLTDDTSLFIVGDDDQCIYEWRGAHPDYLRDFVGDTEHEVIHLCENFRSEQSIVSISDSLIGHNLSRIVKSIFPGKKQKKKAQNTTIAKRFDYKDEEAQFIASEIKRLVDAGEYNYSDFAILVRGSLQVEPIKAALERSQIPCYEQTEHDSKFNDFFRVLATVDRFDRKGGIVRAINYPTMVMDNFAYEDVVEQFGLDPALPHAEVFQILESNGEAFEDADIFRGRYRLVRKLSQEAAGKPVAEVVKELYEHYLSEPCATSKRAKGKLDELSELLDIAKEFDLAYQSSANTKHSAIQEFLDFVNLSAQDESYEDHIESAVNLMTCHKSKGLEFPVVFIPGVQVGVFPNDYFITTKEELEAERRLFYVSMTRAIDKLYITCYDDPIKGNGYVKKGFLAEIPGIRF